MRNKKLIVIVAIALVLAAIIPWPLPYSYDIDLAKTDYRGNTLDTCTVRLHGWKTHSLIFGKSLVTVKYDGFDAVLPGDFKPSAATASLLGDYSIYGYAAAGVNSDGSIMPSTGYDIHFSHDYDCWMFMVTRSGEANIYYVGSVSGKYSVAELWEFFGRGT